MSTIPRSVALAAVLLARVAGAVESYHTGDELVCADCHSMHFSLGHGYEGGPVGSQPVVGGDWLPPGGPNGHLLKLPPDQLCVACHDGGGVLAPDVIAPVDGDPAGGAFAATQTLGSTGDGHTLGAPLSTVQAKRPAGAARELGCASCHSAHGSESFRNLRTDPADRGEQHLVVARSIAPAGKTPGRTARADLEAAYASDSIVYESGVSGWCRACHAEVHATHAGDASSLFHRDDAPLSDSPSVSVEAWLGSVDRRVRVERPSTGPGDGRPSADDRVMCLTCHRAHGSGRRASLIFADGETLTSTCQQCHDE